MKYPVAFNVYWFRARLWIWGGSKNPNFAEDLKKIGYACWRQGRKFERLDDFEKQERRERGEL